MKAAKSLFEKNNKYGKDVQERYKSNQKDAKKKVDDIRNAVTKEARLTEHIKVSSEQARDSLKTIKAMLSEHSETIDVKIGVPQTIDPDSQGFSTVEKTNDALSGLISKDVVESLDSVSIELHDKKKYRASYSEKTSKINLGKNEMATWDVGTIAHEMGHALEYHGELLDAAIGFLMSLTDADGFDYITKIADTSHDLNEVGHPDDFGKLYERISQLEVWTDAGQVFPPKERGATASAAYNGKIYLNARRGEWKVRSTEIFSMGLENLTQNPVAFAEYDPDYFNFMIASLLGYHSKK